MNYIVHTVTNVMIVLNSSVNNVKYMSQVLYAHRVLRLERTEVVNFIQVCLWDSNPGRMKQEVVLIVGFQCSSLNSDICFLTRLILQEWEK
jgi:hypothetical protein